MDLEQITTPFGQLFRETQLALFSAWVDGRRVMYCASNGEWQPCFQNPLWYEDTAYRIAPLPKTPDSIDWSHVAPQYIAIARDDDGLAYFYKTEPRQFGSVWRAAGGTIRAVSHASYVRGTCDWRDSLVMRPANPEAAE